jgi:hypothetical protein
VHVSDDIRANWKDMLRRKMFLNEHRDIKERQRQAFNKAKETISDEELIILVDFKQNIQLGHGPMENQDVWRSLVQNTVLGMVLWSSAFQHGKVFVDFVSSVLSHTAGVAIDCLKQLLAENWLKSLNFKTIKFWFDCGPHFRCSEMAHFVLKELPLYAINTEMNFFAERHGKGECDSHFSHVTSWLEDAARKSDINSTNAAIQAIISGHDKANQYRQEQAKKQPTELFVFEYDPPASKNIYFDHLLLQVFSLLREGILHRSKIFF